jgi:uncharacterized protein YycO
MDLQPLDIIVFKGRWWNPMTHFIRHRTSTAWTHCALYVGEGKLVEAVASGVVVTPLEHYAGRPGVALRYQFPIHEAHVMAALQWLADQVEEAIPYDLVAFLGFITGLKAFEEENKFYCAELPVYAYLEAGINLFNEPPAFIYPCEFVQSNDFEEVSKWPN